MARTPVPPIALPDGKRETVALWHPAGHWSGAVDAPASAVGRMGMEGTG